MKTIIKCLLNIIVLGITSGAFCQTEENTPLPKRIVLEEWLFRPFPAQVSLLLIHQHGTENLTTINQYGTGAMVSQRGLYNEVHSTQMILGGKIQIRQNGNANQYHGLTTGEEIELSILQLGDHNRILQNLSGNQLMFEVIQEGNFNEVNQIGDNWPTPLKIQQRGNDMRLIIRSRY